MVSCPDTGDAEVHSSNSLNREAGVITFKNWFLKENKPSLY